MHHSLRHFSPFPYSLSKLPAGLGASAHSQFRFSALVFSFSSPIIHLQPYLLHLPSVISSKHPPSYHFVSTLTLGMELGDLSLFSVTRYICEYKSYMDARAVIVMQPSNSVLTVHYRYNYILDTTVRRWLSNVSTVVAKVCHCPLVLAVKRT